MRPIPANPDTHVLIDVQQLLRLVSALLMGASND